MRQEDSAHYFKVTAQIRRRSCIGRKIVRGGGVGKHHDGQKLSKKKVYREFLAAPNPYL